MIISAQEYRDALKRIDEIWNLKFDAEITAEFARLCKVVDDYESEVFPIEEDECEL